MATKTEFFKLHKKDNRGLMDDFMFEKAPVVFFKVPPRGNPTAWFLLDQSKEEDFNEVGWVELDDFELPEKAMKVSKSYFERLNGKG